MADKQYLSPKVSMGDKGKVKRVNNQFVNVDSMPSIGGFTSNDKWGPKPNPSLALEKGGPSAQKGKPI